MAANLWVVDVASNTFLYGGFYVPAFDAATQILVTMPDETMPDPIMERYASGAPSKRRAADASEQLAAHTTITTANAVSVALQKDQQATIAYIYQAVHGSPPSAGQLAAELAAWKTIYEGL